MKWKFIFKKATTKNPIRKCQALKDACAKQEANSQHGQAA
jgi:hypothetical protein